MNQIDAGKFIASCRKEKGLTQAQWLLALWYAAYVILLLVS